MDGYVNEGNERCPAITDPSVSPTYDEDGNMTFDGTWTYSWNGENRLASATDCSTTITYVYDYMGRLVERDDGMDVARYIYDGWNRITTLQAGSVTATNLWGLDLSLTLQGAGGVGGLLKEGGLYPLYDDNGNICQKLDASGNAVMAVEYDPFGNIISGSLVGEYGFSTKLQDAETGFYYYGYRWYDTEWGRWLSRDPLGSSGGVNIYGFIGNSCGNTYDILGLQGQTKMKCCGNKKLAHGQSCCGGKVFRRGRNNGLRCCGSSDKGELYSFSGHARGRPCCSGGRIGVYKTEWEIKFSTEWECINIWYAALWDGETIKESLVGTEVIPCLHAKRICNKLHCDIGQY